MFSQQKQQKSASKNMEKYPIKEDLQTELLSNQSVEFSKHAPNALQEFTTINEIMDQIHQQVIFNKPFLRSIDNNEENKIQCRKWGKKQTENFYSLLSKMGPDFTNMELHEIFHGNRCKRELKNKYRKEQKKNQTKVNIYLDMYYDRNSVEDIRK